MAQRLACWAHNPKVGCSNQPPATFLLSRSGGRVHTHAIGSIPILDLAFIHICPEYGAPQQNNSSDSSVVEHHLYGWGTGSNPVQSRGTSQRYLVFPDSPFRSWSWVRAPPVSLDTVAQLVEREYITRVPALTSPRQYSSDGLERRTFNPRGREFKSHYWHLDR